MNREVRSREKEEGDRRKGIEGRKREKEKGEKRKKEIEGGR